MVSCPAGDPHTLPTATQLPQPVTTCVPPLVSYAGLVEQMTWLTRKSHRSSAPSDEQGRNGARPPHSAGAVVPHAGAPEVGPRDEAAGAAGPPEPPDPRDTAPQDTAPPDMGPEDAGTQDTGERQSAMRAAVDNTAFRAASRGVWPGTEDRAEPAPSTPQPAPDTPGVSSFGPLGAAPPNPGQAGRSSRPDEQIWEPRRLYQQPLLKPRRRGDSASPHRPSQPRPAQQPPEQPGPQQGTAPRNVRSGRSAVPQQQGPQQQGTAQQGAPQPRRDIPVQRLAITAGSDPARGSGPDTPGSRDPQGSSGGQGPGGPPAAGPERMADRLHLGDLMADSR